MKRMASGRGKSSASDTSTRRRKRTKRSAPRFVVCVENGRYPVSLELHKIYRILTDKEAEGEGDLRVVDESGEDYLYPAKWFVPVEVPRSVERSFSRTA